MLARALIGEYFMKNGNGWFIEMVQADITIGEISTFQREKCLAVTKGMSNVRPSNLGCSRIVGRALRYLEMLSAAPRASLTLPSSSPNCPRASRIG